MKKLLSFVISVSMTILSLFCGCSENSSKADKSIVETTKATEQQTTEQTTTVAPTTVQPTTAPPSAVKIFDENKFLLSPNEYMKLFDVYLQDVKTKNDYGLTLMSDSYLSRDEIEIRYGSDSSKVFMSLNGNDSLNDNMKQVTLYVDFDQLMNNYTDYRSTIISILGVLPYSIDNKIKTPEKGKDLIAELFNKVTVDDFSKIPSSGKHRFKSGKLPVNLKKNGVTYTLWQYGDRVCVTASIKSAKTEIAPMSDKDFIIYYEDGTEEDAIKGMQEHDSETFYFFDDTNNIANYTDSITDDGLDYWTYRNISTGSSKSAVKAVYGDGISGTVDISTDEYYRPCYFSDDENEAEVRFHDLFEQVCKTYVDYYGKGHKIRFYFDSNDKLSWCFIEL